MSLKLQRQSDSLFGCLHCRLAEGEIRPFEILVNQGAEQIARHDERFDPQLPAEHEALEMAPMLAPGIALTDQEASLVTGHRGDDPMRVHQPADIVERVRLEIAFELAEPNFDRRAGRPRSRQYRDRTGC